MRALAISLDQIPFDEILKLFASIFQFLSHLVRRRREIARQNLENIKHEHQIEVNRAFWAGIILTVVAGLFLFLVARRPSWVE